MAGRGPAPSTDAVRRNIRPTAGVPADPVPVPPLTGNHLPATVAWYETWTKSPQARYFLSTDWQRLAMLAPLVDEYFTEPSVKVMAELRQHEASLGATVTDRLRLNMQLDAEPAAASKPRSSRDRNLTVVPPAS